MTAFGKFQPWKNAAAPHRRHRRGLCRHRGRARAGALRPDGHADRPAEPSSVPAAALSGRDRGAFARRHRRADPQDAAQRTERRSDARRGDAHRSQGARPSRWAAAEHRLRHPGARDRGDARLFRPRRMGRRRAGPQDHRGCAPHPLAPAARLRARGDEPRSGRAEAADDHRGDRRRARPASSSPDRSRSLRATRCRRTSTASAPRPRPCSCSRRGRAS